jgi:hypothetical protein
VNENIVHLPKPPDDRPEWLPGEEISEEQQAHNELVHKQISPFMEGEKQAVLRVDGPIHPGDWVVLSEGDPYFVGNHPLIATAHQMKIPGRVVSRSLRSLSSQEAVVLSQKLNRAMIETYEVRVKFFKEQENDYVFFEPFLEKVKVSPKTAIEVRE